MRLVDDLYGKIDHILITYYQNFQASLAQELAEKMDSDVVISVAYPKEQEGSFGSPPKSIDEIRKRHKNVEPFPIDGWHTEWIQDTVHAYENNTLMHSTPSKIMEASPDKVLGYTPDPEKGKNILDAPYWDEIGFRIIENDSNFMVVGGEAIRCGDYAYLGTESWIYFLDEVMLENRKLSKEIKYFQKFGIETKNIEKIYQAFIKHTGYISGDCNTVLIGPSVNKKIGMHLDLYFHPHENGCFISKSSLYDENEKNLPMSDENCNIEKNLSLLKIKNSREVPIFLKRENGDAVIVEQTGIDGKKMALHVINKTPFYSPINSLFEIYEKNGESVRNVYMPHYGKSFEPASNSAESSFAAEGFHVNRITFPLMDAGGGLRCCTKVLKRRQG